MAAKPLNPIYHPDTYLYIYKNEKDTQGQRVTDKFVWPVVRNDNALWGYLKRHANVKDWQSIHLYIGKADIQTYNLTGATLSQAWVTKMQNFIASGPGAVSIRLVLKSGAVQKTQIMKVAPMKPALIPAGKPMTTIKPARAPKHSATEDTEQLEELLHDLHSLTNLHDHRHFKQ